MEPFAIFEGEEPTRLLGVVPMYLPTSIVPVMWNDRGTVRPVGTAWCINASLGLFVSAYHILLGIREIEEAPTGYGSIQDPDLYILVPDKPGSSDKAGVRVTEISINTAGEVLLFRVDLGGFPAGVVEHLRDFGVSTHRPELGAKCLVVGYPDEEVVTPPDSQSKFTKTLSLRASQGPVLDLFPYKRDNFSGPFPSFHLEAYGPTGMSGGPVADQNGGIVGVLSRGMTEANVCFIASIAPLLTMSMPGSKTDEPIGNRADLSEILRISGPSISVRPNPEGGSEVVWL